MSLVNDMLRDLEQRKAPGSTPAGVQPVLAAASVKRKYTGLIAAIVLVLVAGLAYWVWQARMAGQTAKIAETQPVPLEQSTLPTPASQAERDAAPALKPPLAQARWEASESGWSLVLSLPGQARAVIAQSGPQQLVLVLEGAEVVAFPPLPDESLLEPVRLNNTATATELHISSRQPAVFSLRRESAQVVLHIQRQPAGKAKPGVSPGAAQPGRITQQSQLAQPVVTRAATQPAAEPAVAVQPAKPVIKAAARKPDQKAVVRQAREALKQGNTRRAQLQLRGWLAEQPDAEQARALLAGILLTQGRYTQAQELLKQGLALNPHATELRKLAARRALAEQEIAQAVELLRSQPPALSQDAEYHALLASAEYQAGEYSAAAQRYLSLLEYDKAQPQWWLGLGLALEQQGRAAQAARAYQSLARLPAASQIQRNYARQRLAQIARGG